MIDNLDMRIVAELEVDARQSSDQLAEKLGVSASTVRRRIGKLVEKNAIRIVALPNPSIMDETVSVMIELNVSKGASRTVADTLLEYNQVRFVSRCLGRYNVIAAARFGSVDELQEFLDGLTQIEGIVNYETALLHMPQFG